MNVSAPSPNEAAGGSSGPPQNTSTCSVPAAVTHFSALNRWVLDRVPHAARVLDLGCGDGALLQALSQHKACPGYGVEIDDANVLACTQRGVQVLQLNLEEGLSMFEDQSFDVVLQLNTLQHLRHTERMLQETARVGRLGIVAFPNFAHWPNRLAVLLGRMPVTKILPYEWYNTPNIRVGTFADFHRLVQKNGLRVVDAFGLQNGRLVRAGANWRTSTAVFVIAGGQGAGAEGA